MDQNFNYTRRLRRLRTTAVQGSFIAGSVFCGLLFFNPTAEEGTHLAWVKVRHVCVLNMVRSFYSNCVVLFLVHLHLLVGGNFRWQFSQFFDFHPHQYLDGRHERSTAADAFFVGRGYAGSVGFRSLHGGPGSQFNALFIFTKHADLCCLLCSMGGCSP